MTRTAKTNPAYAYLAYRKAVLDHLVFLLHRDYVGLDGLDPKNSILSEDVFNCDAQVPIDEILQFVEEMQKESMQIQFELSRFEFRRKDENEQQPQQKATASYCTAAPAGSQASRAGKRPTDPE